MTGGVAAAPRWRWQVGRHRLGFDGRRWSLDDGMIGVGNYRTPWGAISALRRVRRQPAVIQVRWCLDYIKSRYGPGTGGGRA